MFGSDRVDQDAALAVGAAAEVERTQRPRPTCLRRRRRGGSGRRRRRGLGGTERGRLDQSASATCTTLPLTVTAWLTDRRRLSTSRVRSCAWTMLTERRSPWLNSTALRPTLLSVPGRSMAIRAGLATEKLGGTSFNGDLSWIVSSTPAAVCVASIRSTLLAAATVCACAGTGPRAGTEATATHAAAKEEPSPTSSSLAPCSRRFLRSSLAGRSTHSPAAS